MPRTNKLKMPTINEVVIGGTVTREPELRHIPSGKAVVKIGIAHNTWKPGRDGAKGEEEAHYYDLKVWGDAAEKLAATVSKGDPVIATGRLSTNRWTDDEGKNQQRVEIVAFRVQRMTWPEEAETIQDLAKKNTVEGVGDVPF